MSLHSIASDQSSRRTKNFEYDRKSYDGEATVDDVKRAVGNINSQLAGWVKDREGRINSLGERLADVEQCLAKARHSAECVGPAVLDVSSLVQSEGFQRLASGAQDRSGKLALGIETKSLLNYSEATTAGTAMPVRPDRLPGFHGVALRPLRLLDILNVRPTVSSVAEFVQLNSTGDAEVQEVEGEEKAEAEFEGELVQARVATIAVHTTASAQVLADNAALSTELQRILGHKVLDRAERQMVVGSGVGQNIEGLYTQAIALTTYESAVPDRIGAGLNAMETAGYAPDVVLLHPSDWFSISILKDDQGRYLYGNPASPAPPTLWNRPVITTPSLPVGTALIGDSALVEVLEREPPSVFISRDHKDYRTRNLVLLLVECRLAMTLYDRMGFRRIGLGSAT